MLIKIKDPISGLTHLAGALLGVWGLVFLLQRSIDSGTAMHIVAFSIFGGTLVLLYLSSALYHLLIVSERAALVLRKLDHSMIFVFIAGCYTPFCLVSLDRFWGWTLLTSVWVAAFAGLFVKLYWIHAPRWISTGLYLLMGWAAILIINPLSRALSPQGLTWLVAAGLCYTVGAVVYVIKRPDPFPQLFGFHEIWHLFVLAGSTCHFLSVATLVS